MKKTCKICKKTFDISEFFSNGFTPKGKQKTKPYCKICEGIYNKNRKLKAIQLAYGKPLACEICGYNKNFAALDFHHTDPNKKEGSISHLGIKGLIKEIPKCILLCRNCHSELHYPENVL